MRRLRAELPPETTLIGFCGAPWTVATYMIAGRGTPDQAPARLFAYRHPEAMRKLLKLLADQSAAYLIRQIDAGADVVQIFDSWSGVLDEQGFAAFCVEPIAEIVKQVRAAHPTCRSSLFPRAPAAAMTVSGRRRCHGARPRLDGAARPGERLQRQGAVQGNLDPQRLVAGGKALSEGDRRDTRQRLGDGPLVFNLGHGITPETPIAHVEAMIAQVRSARR